MRSQGAADRPPNVFVTKWDEARVLPLFFSRPELRYCQPTSRDYGAKVTCVGIFTSMPNFNEIVANVPQAIQWAFAGIGALYVGSKVLGYLQFVLGVFVLSGTNVSSRGPDSQ